MLDIQNFIKSAASNLGVSEGATRTATSGLLQILQARAGGADFQKLLDAIPGAAQILEQSPQPDEAASGGGLLGGALSQAASLTGGGLGGSIGALGKLQSSGLSMDQLGSFADLFVSFAKSKVGTALIQQLLAKAPEVQKLLGSA